MACPAAVGCFPRSLCISQRENPNEWNSNRASAPEAVDAERGLQQVHCTLRPSQTGRSTRRAAAIRGGSTSGGRQDHVGMPEAAELCDEIQKLFEIDRFRHIRLDLKFLARQAIFLVG